MATKIPHILMIFDIDGTLAHSDGATGRAFSAAFANLTGVNVGFKVTRPHGMTDPQIFREMLSQGDIKVMDFPKIFAEFQELFYPLMHKELAFAAGARLLPGVRELLYTLSTDSRFALALGTGNLKTSAYEKLRIHHVDHYFPVGGFGSDAEDRADVIRIAFERSQQYWNTQFDLSDTWVIGDTPKDIAAGKALGANTIGIASSIFPEDELYAADPNAVLNSLEDREAFLNIILCR
jgi:phosphoglycolate phosphatase